LERNEFRALSFITTARQSDLLEIFIFAQHKGMIALLGEVPMKHLVGIGVVVTFAFAMRYWLQRIALDIYIHDTYRVFPLSVVVFWCLMGAACLWFIVVAWKFARHHS
jgi:hypothetical protein